MTDVIDIDRLRARRPQLFRSPGEMAALRLAEHDEAMTFGPAPDRLCAVVPAGIDEDAFEIPQATNVIDLQAVRDSMEVMPDRPRRMAGWTTLALILMTAAFFAVRILQS